MPKVRDRTRIGQEFAVLPWQQRHDEKEVPEDALYSVQSMNLFAPSGTQFPREAVLADAKPSDEDLTEEPDDELDSGGWITKDTSAEPTPTRRRAATHAAAGPRPAGAPASVLTMVLHEPAATLQYAPGSGGDPDLASGSDTETQPPEQEEEDGVEADAADSREPRRPPELLGVCQLAITPSGRGMGHIVITGSVGVAGGAHACAGATRPAVLVLGVATQPVAATEELDPCFADESFDLLRLRLTHMQPSAPQAAADLEEGPGSAAAAAAAPATNRGCSSSGNGSGSSGGRSSRSRGRGRGRGRSVEVLVSRTGGDMARLTAPPEEWLVRRTLGDHALALMRQRQQQRGQQPGMGGEETGLQREQKDGQEEGHRRHQAGAGGYCYSSDSEGEPLLDPRLDPFIAQGLGLASGTRAAARRRRQPAGGAGGGAVRGGGGAKSPRRRGRGAANAEAKAEAGDADDGAPGMAPAGEGSGRRAARVKRQRTGAGRPVPREEGQSEEGQQGDEEEEEEEEEEGWQGEEEAGTTASEEDGTEAGDDADDDSDDGDDIEPEADVQLSFQPETLLSGGAALARMADFARPLLPRRLRLAAATAAAAAGPAGVDVKMEGEAGAGAGAGAGDKGAEARGGAGGVPAAAGGWAEEDEEWEEAVVCVGPVRVRGLPRSWRRCL